MAPVLVEVTAALGRPALEQEPARLGGGVADRQPAEAARLPVVLARARALGPQGLEEIGVGTLGRRGQESSGGQAAAAGGRTRGSSSPVRAFHAAQPEYRESEASLTSMFGRNRPSQTQARIAPATQWAASRP